MKKRIIFVSIVFLMFLTSCDPFTGQRPLDYPNTRWVAENPDMYFEVGDERNVTYCQITIDGEPSEIICSFHISGKQVNFYDLSARILPTEEHPYEGLIGNKVLFTGLCEFSPKKLIVRILDNEKGFLDDSIEEIVFIREDM